MRIIDCSSDVCSSDLKLKVAEQLDWLGVAWIEGGYPQANPKDAEFFRRAVTELQLETATLVAFGSTRKPLGKVDVDPTLNRSEEHTSELQSLMRTSYAVFCLTNKTNKTTIHHE